jgi:hypothetical protein
LSEDRGIARQEEKSIAYEDAQWCCWRRQRGERSELGAEAKSRPVRARKLLQKLKCICIRSHRSQTMCSHRFVLTDMVLPWPAPWSSMSPRMSVRTCPSGLEVGTIVNRILALLQLP